ncbi:C40 family peptidase [Carboxylicivirga taeanensis]|uniref:C40 family peptidase n=1 Tax=Carboxylicivirga taeanensis TaxID=1416875 RepID=UPI003F6E1FEB
MKISISKPILTLIFLFLSVLGAESQTIKQQLKAYREEGVKKELDIKGVNPEAVITSARYFLGVKHRLGGLDHEGLDCSGLVYISFQKHGISMPRSSSEQGRYGKQIHARNSLERGDLVFFHMSWSKKLVNHVGIYLGDDEFIHVSSSNGCIISKLSDKDWKKGFLFGTRVW